MQCKLLSVHGFTADLVKKRSSKFTKSPDFRVPINKNFPHRHFILFYSLFCKRTLLWETLTITCIYSLGTSPFRLSIVEKRSGKCYTHHLYTLVKMVMLQKWASINLEHVKCVLECSRTTVEARLNPKIVYYRFIVNLDAKACNRR